MKCRYCKNPVKWQYAEQGGWHVAELDGSWHSCNAGRLLDQVMVKSIRDSVSQSDKWLADKFIKRLALFRWLYPKATISPQAFTNGTLSDRQYVIRCSDKAFKQIMKTGKTGLMQKRDHAEM